MAEEFTLTTTAAEMVLDDIFSACKMTLMLHLVAFLVFAGIRLSSLFLKKQILRDGICVSQIPLKHELICWDVK